MPRMVFQIFTAGNFFFTAEKFLFHGRKFLFSQQEIFFSRQEIPPPTAGEFLPSQQGDEVIRRKKVVE
jgi:hypothetical protein